LIFTYFYALELVIMNSQDKLKEFVKRLLLDAFAQFIPIPGSVQFACNVAQNFHDIYITADKKDLQTLIEGARNLNPDQLRVLIEEINRSFGQYGNESAIAINGVVDILRTAPPTQHVAHNINSHILGHTNQTLIPRVLSAQQQQIATAVGSRLINGDDQSRIIEHRLHPSQWPQVKGFRLLKVLGQGNFAYVYLAHELDPQGNVRRACALKVGDLYDRTRFQREVRALSLVSHKNLIDYYGSGILKTPSSTHFWISMPNLSGLTLATLMQQNLSTEQKIILIVQILDGLCALHEYKISHRDLKPENALIGSHFEVKLTDFGLSKSENSDPETSLVTKHGDILGTPAYMSPEQVKGLSVGMEADVWAFGVILYELFVGKRPFEGNIGEVLGKIQYEQINWSNSKIPREFVTVLKNCMEHNLSRRYKSALNIKLSFYPIAENLRKQLRHERFRGSWNILIKEHWIEEFAAKHHGVLPTNPVEAFLTHQPGAMVDPERLSEIFPPVFKAHTKLENLYASLPRTVDWDAEFASVEEAAVATLGLTTVHEAVTRASEVTEVKQAARKKVKGRKQDLERQVSKIQKEIQKAKDMVTRVTRAELKDEVTDYQQLMAQEEQKRRDAETQKIRQQKVRRRRTISVFALIVFTILTSISVWYWMEIEAERELAERIAQSKRDYDKGHRLKRRKKYKEAVRWFRKATEQDHASAQNSLGVMYENGQGVKKDYKEAYKWYRKAAEQGYDYAQNNLGTMYNKGKGVEQNYKEAIKWYRKAAEQGRASAQNNLGVMYNKGKGLEQNYIEAYKWYRKAAEQGYKYAQNNLGFMYEKGRGVKKDDQEAVKWYRKAAEQGHASGQYNLGDMYEHGKGVKKDQEKAIEWYRKATQQEHVVSKKRLSKLLEQREQKKIHAQSKKDFYKGFQFKKNKKYKEALKWYLKAAEQGYASAQNNLGVMYKYGQGVKKDYKEAVKWYRKAALQNEVYGQRNLGVMYENGQGVKKDYKEAVKWYRKSVAQKNAFAQNNLGIMYEKGRGIEKNYVKALKLYRKAAKQNHASAQYNLGLVYEYGKGVKKDYKKAAQWYRKARDNGHQKSITKFGQMRKKLRSKKRK
jgi:TPR repeat protein/serine/threonine protein kinase